MTDASKMYRLAWAINSVKMNMDEQERGTVTALDAEAVWAVFNILNEHRAVSENEHAQVRHKDMTAAAFDAPKSASIEAANQVFDKAA